MSTALPWYSQERGISDIDVSAQILDGKLVASRVKDEIAVVIAGLDYTPGLATVLVGDDPASHS